MTSLELCNRLIVGNLYSFDTDVNGNRTFISDVVFVELTQKGNDTWVIYRYPKFSARGYREAVKVKDITRILGTLSE